MSFGCINLALPLYLSVCVGADVFRFWYSVQAASVNKAIHCLLLNAIMICSIYFRSKCSRFLSYYALQINFKLYRLLFSSIKQSNSMKQRNSSIFIDNNQTNGVMSATDMLIEFFFQVEQMARGTQMNFDVLKIFHHLIEKFMLKITMLKSTLKKNICQKKCL